MGTRLRFRTLSLLAGLALAVSLSVGEARWVVIHAASGPSAPTSLATCHAQPKVVPSPSPGSAFNELLGIAKVSATNLWAVGDFQNTGGVAQTLIEHWNGSSWSVVPSPSPGSADNRLLGIAKVSATNLWAVGDFQNTGGVAQTLIEHWNGSSWSVVPSPSPGSADNRLLGIAKVSATNLWAVGDFLNPDRFHTLIEHWNGSSWSVVPSPSPGSADNRLLGIAKVSASNLWVVGGFVNTLGVAQTLIEHWNGSSWSVVPSPSPGSFYNDLFGIAKVSASNLWAVGSFLNLNTGGFQTLIEHWNGSSWSVVPSPTSPGSGFNELGIAKVSASNLWVVGGFVNTGGVAQTLIEHWNGSSWSVVPSPSPGSASNDLEGIAKVSASDLWAVGSFQNTGGPFQTLIEHIAGRCHG